jgi:hypothetical protein
MLYKGQLIQWLDKDEDDEEGKEKGEQKETKAPRIERIIWLDQKTIVYFVSISLIKPLFRVKKNILLLPTNSTQEKQLRLLKILMRSSSGAMTILRHVSRSTVRSDGRLSSNDASIAGISSRISYKTNSEISALIFCIQTGAINSLHRHEHGEKQKGNRFLRSQPTTI